MKSVKKILLTGAMGFIGSHLLETLLEGKYNLVVLKKKNSPMWRVEHLTSKVKFFDVNEEYNLEKVFEENEIDCIIHLATFYKKIHNGKDDVKRMVESNILFPSLLLELAVKFDVKYFVNTGTFFEYKLGGEEKITEDSSLEPYNLYAATKISFENILKYYSRNHNIKGITLKLFAPYGEKDNEKLVVYLIKNLLSESKVELTPSEQKWNFTYVADIAGAYLKTLDYIQNMERGYETFNIGSGEVHSIKELVGVLEKISEQSLLVDWGAKPYLPNEIMFVNCDNSKAEKLLKWKSQTGLEEGLKNVYSYYQNNTTNL